MNQIDKATVKVKTLWNMRNLTVDEFLELLSKHPDLKFLLTTVGAWFLLRSVIGIWIGVHVLYFVYRIFNLVIV